MTELVTLPTSPGDMPAALARLVGVLRAQPIVVVAEDLVVASAAMSPLVDDDFAPTSMLVRPAPREGDVRVRHHQVVSVGTTFHEVSSPDQVSVGVLRIAEADREQAADALSKLADCLVSGSVVSRGSDLVELIAVALVRSQVRVQAVTMVDVPWFRAPDDRAAALVAIGKVSDERIARLQANRMDDGFYSTFVVRKLSKPLTRVALRLGMSPNSITLISFAVGLLAAASFALGSTGALIVGAVLLQLSLIIDCVDGEVARATRKFSALGAWLDASTDRVKEFLAYAGLAVGAARLGIDIWWIAIVLVALQTTRHMSDYDFSRVQRMREAYVPDRDIRERSDGVSGAAGGWSVGGAMEASTRLNRRDAVRWAKRAIHMPIGERWLVISVMAAVAGAAWALGTLLVLGVIAFGYVIVGRTLRTLTWRGPTPPAGALLLGRQSDAGPVLSLLSRSQLERVWSLPWGWALPAALRAIELGAVAVIALIWWPAASVAAFWWMSVVAFHHYDVLYRTMQDASTPRWLVWGALGWDGRTILVVVLALTGLLAAVLGWAAGALALLVVVIASIQWLLVQRKPRSPR